MKIQRILLLALLCAMLGTLLAMPVAAATGSGNEEVNVLAEITQIDSDLQHAMREYRLGNFDVAFKAARAAYLDHFELIEIPLRVVDADLTLEMEYHFADLRSQMQAGAPAAEVETAARLVRDGLDEIAGMYAESGALAPTLAFAGSFAIIFREGLEAVLVIAALLGYLQSSGANRRGRRYVFLGVIGAVAASAVTWVLLRVLLNIAPVGREMLEALVTFVAVGMLFWVSFWLVSRLDRKRWMEFLNAKAWAAMTGGSVLGLMGLGFTAVYREGFETALFYEVLLGMSRQTTVYVLYGFLAGLAVLGVVAWLILRAGQRLPISTFMTAAVSIIMLLSVAFIGKGVHELQDTGLIGVTSLIGVLPRLPRTLAEFSGFHPTVETLAAQATLLAIYVFGGLAMWLRSRGGLGNTRVQSTVRRNKPQEANAAR